MCGIAGFLRLEPTSGDGALKSILARMTGSIAHRGPDAEGFWTDVEAGIGFGHRRLAIVDLSEAGSQPMISASGRYVLTYNGEIYNHRDLRRDLERGGKAPSWRGHSDTETLLAAIDAWGLEPALDRATGMFAFALWDKESRALFLARDRLGEKPLYYGWQGQGRGRIFLFGSELKALRAHPAFDAPVDCDVLMLLLRYGYVPTPYSIYAGISKLEPGSIAFLSRTDPEPRVRPYWSAIEAARRGIDEPFAGSSEEAVDALESVLGNAVEQQMMSDVPLGAFLSGGIDSSTIVALMQARSARPVRTFSIGFEEAGFDEAPHARAVARHLGTDHTELYVTPAETLGVIPRLPTLYDEPFADSSQIPTFLVSQLARSQVTVSLSGDGGDELFGGYTRYRKAQSRWRLMSALPSPLLAAAGSAAKAVPARLWNGLGAAMPRPLRRDLLGDRVHRFAGMLGSRTVDDLYHGFASLWLDPERAVPNAAEPPTAFTGNRPELGAMGDVERMMAVDLVTYLLDDILVKVDRASMTVSLESRVPLLDPRVVEFAWSLPLDCKIRDGQTKWALRRLLHRHVPPALIERPKMGFAVPVGSWLRGPLRDWGEALLNGDRIRSGGYFDPGTVSRLWKAHLDGDASQEFRLWPILMFQQWLEAQAEPVARAAVSRAA